MIKFPISGQSQNIFETRAIAKTIKNDFILNFQDVTFIHPIIQKTEIVNIYIRNQRSIAQKRAHPISINKFLSWCRNNPKHGTLLCPIFWLAGFNNSYTVVTLTIT